MHAISKLPKPLKSRMKIKHRGDHVYINISDIVRCQSHSNYTQIYLINNKTFLISKTLKTFENWLQAFKFLRVHHTHLVNLDLVERIEHSGFIVLSDGSRVPYSRRRKKELIKKLEFKAQHFEYNIPI